MSPSLSVAIFYLLLKVIQIGDRLSNATSIGRLPHIVPSGHSRSTSDHARFLASRPTVIPLDRSQASERRHRM
ncbi:hypothetical protein, partial [Pandoraea sputorum]|uniref:hypothetical protein n=1 Tax=Pandoraea sputorum TaxID=93222 RepID=UPI0035583B8A